MEKSKPLATILAGAFLTVSTPSAANEPEEQRVRIDILTPVQDDYRLHSDEQRPVSNENFMAEDGAFEANEGRLSYKFEDHDNTSWSMYAGRGESDSREIMRKAGIQDIQRRGRGVGAGVAFSLKF